MTYDHTSDLGIEFLAHTCLILIDDTLIIERGVSYFELEKVGGIKLYDSNVESDKTDQRVPLNRQK